MTERESSAWETRTSPTPGSSDRVARQDLRETLWLRYYRRMATVGTCPLLTTCPDCREPRLHHCALGERLRDGASPEQAVDAALASILWGEGGPAFPLRTNEDGIPVLLDRLCQSHRLVAEEILRSPRPAQAVARPRVRGSGRVPRQEAEGTP